MKAIIGPSVGTGTSVGSLGGMGGVKNVGDLERVLSLAGGGLAIGYGLSRRSALGALMVMAGAPFVWRAVTGHCALKEAAHRRSS